MDFVSQWRRRILAAAGAGAVVPVVILGAALLVGIGGGGISGLGALSQALTGPAVPAADVSGLERVRRTRDAEEAGDLLAQVRPPGPAAVGADGAGPGSTTPGSGDEDGPGDDGDGGRSTPRSTPTPGTEPTPPPGSGAQPTPAPTPTPTEPPSAIRQTGETVAKTVEPVPVVGETGAEVVREIVDAVDDILPPPATPGR